MAKIDDLEALLAEREHIERELKERHSRELAILFTDIVGSTEYFERKGDIEGLTLVRRHNTVLFPIVEAHRGRVVKTIGDSIMAVFDDPPDAVRCAAAMQRGLQAENVARRSAAKELIRIRIGAHAGPVILSGEDVFGDAVNTAARVAHLAGADEIYLSKSLFDRMPEAEGLVATPQGALPLKGKADPVPVVSLEWRGARPGVAPAPATAPAAVWRGRLIALSAAGALLVAALAFFSSRQDRGVPAEPSSPSAGEVQARGAGGGPTRAFAVVLGVNAGLAGGDPLRFADDDAARYARLFDALGGDTQLLTVFDADSRVPYQDLLSRAAIPDRRNLEQALSRVRDGVAREHAAGRRAALYFVYVGHGARDDAGEGFVNLADQHLSRTELHRLLFASAPDRSAQPDVLHVVVDACSAFYVVNARGSAPREAPPATPGDLFGAGEAERAAHAGFVLATSGDAKVHEWSAWRGGVFSHLVRSGIAGAADADLDGRVSYPELGAFIAAASAEIKDPRARIDVHVTAPPAFLDEPLSARDRFQPRRLLFLEPAEKGRITIETDSGERLVDLHKAPGTPAAIALWGARRFHVTSAAGESVVELPGPGVVASGALRFVEPSRGARGGLDEEYRRALLARPFDHAFYRAYCALTKLPPPADPQALTAAALEAGPAEKAAAAVPAGAPPAASAPASGGPLRVAVLPFKNLTSDPRLDGLTQGLGEVMTTELTRVKDVRLVEHGELQTQIDYLELMQTKYFDPGQRARLGRIAGSELVVVGAFQKAAGRLLFVARVVDAETGEIYDAVRLEGAERDVFDLQERFSAGVSQAVGRARDRKASAGARP